MGGGGSGVLIIELGKKFQDFHLAGLGSPQELIVWRITVGHLLVYKVFFLHQILGDKLSWLPRNEVTLSIINARDFQGFPDQILRGLFAI